MCKEKLTLIIVIPEFKMFYVELQASLVRWTQISPIQNWYNYNNSNS